MTKHKKPRYAPTGERIVRTITTPGRAVLPYGTTVLESSGERLTRTTEGWELINGEIVPTAGLDFPVRVLYTGSGYHQTRTERRTTDRAARAHEAKVHRRKNPAATTGRYLGPAPRPGLTRREIEAALDAIQDHPDRQLATRQLAGRGA